MKEIKMVTLDPVRLGQLKQRCRILHKALQNPHLKVSDVVIQDMVSFVELHHHKTADPYDTSIHLRLKQVYALVAKYYGFAGWPHLKDYVIDKDCFYRKCAPVFVFKWFKAYPPALQYHQQHGGYLLQFWGDFVICGQEYINSLGLQHLNKAWQAANFNSVEPGDHTAWNEIKREAVKNYLIINK